MAYSTNPQLVMDRWALVEELAQGRACRWRVSPPTREATRRQAYQIRETLYIASLYPEKFKALASAASQFSIHIVEVGLIEAKTKSNPYVDVTPEVRSSNVAVFGGGSPHGTEPSTVSKQTAAECIDAWRQHLPSSDPLNFPQTTLSDEEMTALYKWAQGNTPKLMLLVGAGSLTISLRDASGAMDSYSWKPPKPAPAEEKFDI